MSNLTSIRKITAGAIGNTLEWYDFAIYGYFATSIGHIFFPKEDPVAQVLAAFGIFALGYLMRPVGGIVIGYIGDRVSRQAALTVSIAAMALPTFLVGIMPGYDVIGIAAPILLTLCRMMQGLSVGGEYTTSLIFMIESGAKNRRGLNGALGCCGAVLGILLGSATGAALGTVMSTESLETWGWRIPFILGLFIGLAGLWLRRHTHTDQKSSTDTKSPLSEIFKNHRLILVKLAGLAAFTAISFYLLFVYIVSWLELADKIAPEKALFVNTLSMIALIPIQILAASLSDRIGRKPILITATIAALIFAYPLFSGMYHHSTLVIQMSQLGFVVIAGAYFGTMPTFMVESSPKHVRTTVVALGYNLTLGIIGGLTPAAASWMVHRTHNDLSPVIMIMGAAIVSLIAILSLPETLQKEN